MLTVLSLFDYTGTWSKPYRDANYDVRQVDIRNGDDVVMIEDLGYPVRGILAAPPCTHFAASGARWWAEKGDDAGDAHPVPPPGPLPLRAGSGTMITLFT